ncbi:MAG: phosphoenolpyruvate--protein phosphotransferase [Deltaproteobacteria bacterium]|nr:phosphoenolpyruvate--protein phosphotransferase [Deltaproteobacteria bacterium]
MLEGIGAAPGVAFGHVHLIDRRRATYPKFHVPEAQAALEVQRLLSAIVEARASLVALKERAPDHSAILDAHLLMMEDPMLLDGARRYVAEEHRCAEWALRSAVQDIRSRFDALGDAYFRERRSDVDFVGDRILSAMTNSDSGRIEAAPHDAVVVAHDLSPADTIALSKRKVRAIVTEVGGATSHTAILARALDIPAVLGCAQVTERAGAGDLVIVDGSAGEVVLEPDEALIARYHGVADERATMFAALQREVGQPCVTPDGRRVVLFANIEIPEEIPAALAAGAEGVGLYRSEFLYVNRQDLPDEAAHAEVCGAILDALGDRPATLRTFDIGSDKMAKAVKLPREHNPALGLRACRLGLARPPMLRSQLRGMVRAISARKRGSILLPMIGSVEELTAVRELLAEEMDKLAHEGVEVWRELKVGVMIELPAAVWIADELAQHCDFFSVGTNDLIQYALGIDRGNEQVAHLYQPLHPAVLRALEHTVGAARRHGIPISLCGESASDPALAPVVLGLGFDALSMPGMAIPRVRYVLSRIRFADAQALLAECLRQSRAREVEALINELVQRAIPEAMALLRDAAHS